MSKRFPQVVRVLSVLAWSGLLLSAQGPDPRPVTGAEKKEALTALAGLLRTRYAVAETGRRAADLLDKKSATGGYDRFSDASTFAAAVTADLRSATSDKHLDFGLPAAPPAALPGAPDDPALRAAEARRGHYGLPKAEILPGNVGLLEVRRFQPPDQAGDTIAAAAAFLAGADAVIIDVRNCRGGSAYTMPLFTGYFLPRPTSLYDMVFRGDGAVERFWSAAWLPGKKLADVPLYILTSAYTFSGAEALAYRFQVLKRAVIVGETTGGGANAGGVVDAGPLFRVWLPMGRPVDAQTGTNWEGTGVVPDIRTSAREALPAAHAAALRALRAGAVDDRDRARLDAALEWAEARLHPVDPGTAELEKLAGTYGPCRVWVEGGQLRLQRGAEAPFLLRPFSRTVFASETHQPVRLAFVLAENGEPAAAAYTDEDGASRTYPKTR